MEIVLAERCDRNHRRRGLETHHLPSERSQNATAASAGRAAAGRAVQPVADRDDLQKPGPCLRSLLHSSIAEVPRRPERGSRPSRLLRPAIRQIQGACGEALWRAGLSSGLDWERLRAHRILELDRGLYRARHVGPTTTGTPRRGHPARTDIHSVLPQVIGNELALSGRIIAKPPRRTPRWLGRLAAGETATLMMTDSRGSSNAKAKRELGWQPHYATWRLGFAQGLG